MKIFWVSLFLFLGVVQPGFSQLNLKGTIWDRPELRAVPGYKVLEQDSVMEIVYEGLPYKNHPQSVFAYYATPGLLCGDRSKDVNLPSVVLVHGGGGKAFREWAIQWAKKGYAAIAMDLRGNGPDKKHLTNGFEEPESGTPYFDVTIPMHDQWMYQAVADVILATNLVARFSEVDPSRIGLNGISWGGIITCVVAGIDSRYKAAVSVYGCGFLDESGRMKKELDVLTEVSRKKWMQQYDPSNYMQKCKIPFLFIDGTNDVHFYLTSLKKTFDLVKKGELCVKPGLKHSHHWGWGNREIYSFINCRLNGTSDLPRIVKTKVKKDIVSAKVISDTPIKQALIYFTTDSTVIQENRRWYSKEAIVKKGRLFGDLPPETIVCFFSFSDRNGLTTTGEIKEVNKRK